MKPSKRKFKLASLSTIVVLALCSVMTDAGEKQQDRAPTAKVPSIAGAEYVGQKMCAVCHVDQGREFSKTAHARIATFELQVARRECESCHGPGSLHIQGRGDTRKILKFGMALDPELFGRGDPSKIIHYSGLPPAEKANTNAYCLSCHNSRSHFDWAGSRHDQANVGCVDCHYPMRATEKLLIKPEPDLCLDCHAQRRAQLSYPSHHPILEGKIKCTDCHNQHGSGSRAMLRQENVSQLCFQCHPEKEGPFTFEHPPVTEDCTICHEPHGTIANNLKKQEEPFLCMQCHPGHQSQLPALKDVLDSREKRQTFYTKCTQCHSTLHGTDLPSTTGLGRFTR
ncbi:MAG: DmsE family decaheme c-type cytochrome [Acidobacteria bacterium]|nr:DmsE family decaheme c-type cytochrome [Acidobacteriota bacterium]